MSNKIRFMYLRDEHRSPIGCVAIKLHRKKWYLEYQVSVVNPIDRVNPYSGKSIPFDRQMARDLALGRLSSQGLRVTIDEDATMVQITRAVMQDLSSLDRPSQPGDVPSRAIRAAKLWVRNSTGE